MRAEWRVVDKKLLFFYFIPEIEDYFTSLFKSVAKEVIVLSRDEQFITIRLALINPIVLFPKDSGYKAMIGINTQNWFCHNKPRVAVGHVLEHGMTSIVLRIDYVITSETMLVEPLAVLYSGLERFAYRMQYHWQYL